MAYESGKETDTVAILSIKLFRFGLLMFVFALSFGIWLWQGFGIGGNWLNIKLIFVGLLFIYFVISGWLMFQAMKNQRFINNMAMRLFNEFSLFLVVPIIYLVVSKAI